MGTNLSIQGILEEHIKRYPRMQPDDLYKLLMQAAMGSEHAVEDIELAKTFLQNEIQGLSSEPMEPLVDPLSPDGLIVRVNLRPLLKAGGDPEELLNAFIRTASEHTGDRDTLKAYLDTAISMSHTNQLPFRADELSTLFSEMEHAGYPAIHHSPIYEQAYRPAYRVILSTLFTALMDGSLQ
jgi:hypothetical protein